MELLENEWSAIYSENDVKYIKFCMSEFIDYLKLADSVATLLVETLGLVSKLFTDQQRLTFRVDYHAEREKVSKEVLDRLEYANGTGHKCLANLTRAEDLPHDEGSFGFRNLHLLEHFFTSSFKSFATFFCNLFDEYGVVWTADNFKTLFKCCGDNLKPEQVLESLDGMLIGHRARVVQLETRREEEEKQE